MDREARLARLALVVLAVMLVAAELATVPLSHRYQARLEQNEDSYTQWAAYVASPAPEVLFLGDSRVELDVDTGAVAQDLSAQLNRKVTVGKIGINGAPADELLAFIYRVAHRSSRPRVLIYGLSEHTFAAAFIRDETVDLTNLELPPDAGYLALTLRIGGNRARLAAAYAFPIVATRHLVGKGGACTVQDLKAAIEAAAPIRWPSAGEAAANCDDIQPEDRIMTPAVRESVLHVYRNLVNDDYRFSDREATYVRQIVEMAQDNGMRAALFVPPVNGIDELSPSAYRQFQEGTVQIAVRAGVPRVDLHSELADSPLLWGDPSHLNRAGSRRLAPELAAIVLTAMAGRP